MYLTFDVGTTAIKTCIFRQDLTLAAGRSDEYDLITENSHVELECDTYWRTMCRAVVQLGEKVPLDQVRAICITTQGETMIPVDANGIPLHNAVVWLDDRARAQAVQISQVLSTEALHRHTGLPEVNGFLPLAKLLWFRQAKPEIYKKAEKFLLLEDYLLLKLTGKAVTEKSLQTSTGWFDIRRDGYWTELLAQLDLDVQKLPLLMECGSLAGNILPEAARDLGLSNDVQIVTGAMDQVAAALGGGLRSNAVTATVGTAMAITCSVPEEHAFRDPSMTVYRGLEAGQFILLPYCATAGVVFKWLKDTVCTQEIAICHQTGENIYDRLCAMAAEVPAGALGVTMLPYFSGSIQPRQLPKAKGVFFGLGLDIDRAVMVRAVLESVGFMLRENLEMLRRFGVTPEQITFFGGGSKNPVWNQIIADITGIPLVTLQQEECGSLGAAMLAAAALEQEAFCKNPTQQQFIPDAENQQLYDRCYRRYLRLFDALEPIYQDEGGTSQ